MRGEQEKLRTEAPYSPLSPLEVEALGMPPPSQPDAYLRARIDRFYAELQALSTHVYTHYQLCTHCAGFTASTSFTRVHMVGCWSIPSVAGQDYRPGTLRADVVAEHRRQRRRERRAGAEDGEEQEPQRRHAGQRWEPMTDQANGQNADGSFSRAGTPSSVPPCRIPLPIHVLCIPFTAGRRSTFINTAYLSVGEICFLCRSKWQLRHRAWFW